MKIFVILLIVDMFLTACNINIPYIPNEYYIITYLVNQSEIGTTARIQFNNEKKEIIQLSGKSIPYSYTFTITNNSKMKLFISAQSETNIGRMELSLWINGAMLHSRSSTSPYGYLEIEGTISELINGN